MNAWCDSGLITFCISTTDKKFQNKVFEKNYFLIFVCDHQPPYITQTDHLVYLT